MVALNYQEYIDKMWNERKEFIEEFSVEEYILVIVQEIKERYNFDQDCVINYMKRRGNL